MPNVSLRGESFAIFANLSKFPKLSELQNEKAFSRNRLCGKNLLFYSAALYQFTPRGRIVGGFWEVSPENLPMSRPLGALISFRVLHFLASRPTDFFLGDGILWVFLKRLVRTFWRLWIRQTTRSPEITSETKDSVRKVLLLKKRFAGRTC